MMRWLQHCLQPKVTSDYGFASHSVLQHSIINHDKEKKKKSLCFSAFITGACRGGSPEHKP